MPAAVGWVLLGLVGLLTGAILVGGFLVRDRLRDMEDHIRELEEDLASVGQFLLHGSPEDVTDVVRPERPRYTGGVAPKHIIGRPGGLR